MPEITRQRIGELQKGVLRILRDKPDGMRARDAVAELERIVPPTAFEQTHYDTGRNARRFDQLARFVTIKPVKAGWIVKSKGRWIVTDEGRAALAKFQEPERLAAECTRLYRTWRASRVDTAADLEPDVAEALPTPENDAGAPAALAFEDAEGAAWDQIEAYVSRMDPYDFQNVIAGLISAMGYHVAWVSPPGRDGGIDIIAYADPLGAREPCVKVAVRRRVDKADVKDVREFLSVLHGGDLGLFVSMSGFRKPAEDLARSEPRKIRLLDLEHVFDLWVEHYDRVPEKHRRLLPLRPIWFLALGDE